MKLAKVSVIKRGITDSLILSFLCPKSVVTEEVGRALESIGTAISDCKIYIEEIGAVNEKYIDPQYRSK